MFKHLHPANSYPQANRCPRQLLHELLYLPGALLTNRHVALPWEDDASAEALGEQGIEPVLIKFIGYLPETNDPFPVKILRASDGAELAVLLCEGVTGGIPHLRLGNTSPKKDRHFSATRTGWSKGSGVCDDFMKLRLSSSGCETRPARGEPAWGSVASLATGVVTRPAMRRYAKVWAVGHAATKSISFRVPRVLKCLKATATSP